MTPTLDRPGPALRVQRRAAARRCRPQCRWWRGGARPSAMPVRSGQRLCRSVVRLRS